jgi:REP element-mobilizing transposase RayT
MGYPRMLQIPPNTPGIYHCMSRCVRRAFLCGDDPMTGRSFAHRKIWLEERIIELANVFAVAVHAYAVMSNHFHVVVETDPKAPWRWDDEEVARRWLQLCAPGPHTRTERHELTKALVGSSQRLEVLRERLGSLSWFMRYLKEPIARRANREDQCTGRFWEGRFRSQALLDDPAVLSCMVYVDMNPVRAGLTQCPAQSEHTSARLRQQPNRRRNPRMAPIAASIAATLPPISEDHYLELLDWTARPAQRNPPTLPHALVSLPLSPRQWRIQVNATESQYWRAIGSMESLMDRALQTGRRWLRGIGTARALEQVANTT